MSPAFASILASMARIPTAVDTTIRRGRNVAVQSRPKDLVSRNAPCPCGSNNKYKRCCLGRRDDR